MKNRLQIIVAIFLVSIAETQCLVERKLYGIFHRYVALAQDICIK